MDDTKTTRRRDGKLNGWHENNSPKRWMALKYLAKEMDGWRVKWLAEE